MAVSVGGPDFIRIEPSAPYTKFNKGRLNAYPNITSTSNIMPAGIADDFRHNAYPGAWKWAFDTNMNGYIFSGKTTTISSWFNLRQFQTKIVPSGYPVMKKKSSILRIQMSNDSYIEFGAMAPFYMNMSTGTKPYKGVFSPYSMGCGIKMGSEGGGAILAVNGGGNARMSCSLNTDYKFNLDTWYLLSFEISNFLTGILTFKIFVNDNLELTTFVPWVSPWGRNRVSGQWGNDLGNPSDQHRKFYKRRWNCIAMPGFKTSTQSVLPTSESWTQMFSHKNNFPDSLEEYFLPPNNIQSISTAPYLWGNYGINGANTVKTEFSEINSNSFIEYGTIYIYKTPYNIAHFNNTKLKYLSL